jgi:hypothetical protein
MDRKLVRLFVRFRAEGMTAHDAFRYGRAQIRAQDLGVRVTWQEDDLPWEGECAAPPLVARATVLHPDHGDLDTNRVDVRFPFYDRKDGARGRNPAVLTALGGIGLEGWSDPYVHVVEGDLLLEALDELDAERDAYATIQASEINARPSFAMNLPTE